MIGKLDPEERVLGQEPMQLTPELIDKINAYMAHTKRDGSYNCCLLYTSPSPRDGW